MALALKYLSLITSISQCLYTSVVSRIILMPKDRKLDEELKAVAQKEIAAELEKKKTELVVLKKGYRILKLKRILREVGYAFVISLFLGFSLWSWFPAEFSAYRSAALGILFYIAFEELRLHKMFKQELR